MVTSTICQLCKGQCCTGCKAHDTVSGCILPYDERPPYCQLYPFIFLDDGSRVLSTDCPYWKEFAREVTW